MEDPAYMRRLDSALQHLRSKLDKALERAIWIAVLLPMAQQRTARAAAAAGGLVLVSRLLRSSDTLQTYVDDIDDSFTLIPGTAYVIQVNADVSYVPAHY